MNDINSLLAVLAGLAVRFAIPILVTALAVAFLRKLDARWQSEGERILLNVETPKCWEVKNCTPEKRAHCKAVSSDMPCWQVKRFSNGYLREECLDCDVFRKAPVPVHA